MRMHIFVPATGINSGAIRFNNNGSIEKMAKGRKKAKEKKSGGLFFKLFVLAILLLLLWAAGRFEIKNRTPYEHADALMGVRFLQPIYDAFTGGVSDVTDEAVDAVENLPDSIDDIDMNFDSEKNEAVRPVLKTAPAKDETPLDNVTEEDRKALDDLIEQKSRHK